MKARLSGVIAFLGMGAIAFLMMMPGASAAGTRDSDFLRLPPMPSCDRECNTCPLHNGHSYDVCPNCGNYGDGEAHACVYNQTCGDHGHTKCAPEAPGFASNEEQHAAIVAILDGEPQQLRDLLNNHSNIEYNRIRRLFQIIGCDGNVVANIPASAEWIAVVD